MTPEQVAAKIVKMLYDERANTWSIQEKGVLMAAIKLQLQERERDNPTQRPIRA